MTTIHKSRHILGYAECDDQCSPDDDRRHRITMTLELRSENDKIEASFQYREIDHRFREVSSGAGVPEAIKRITHPYAAIGNRDGDAYGPVEVLSEWTLESLARLAEVADEWHLNALQAGCEHQRAMGWAKLHCNGSHKSEAETCLGALGPNGQAAQLEILGYPNDRRPKERGKDYNTKPWTTYYQCVFDPISVPCPVCHYAYGHEWRYTPIPEDVMAFLLTLPCKLKEAQPVAS